MNGNKKYSSRIKETGISLLSKGITIRIKAHGYSMFPSIRPGSIIIIEPIKVKGPPSRGEIIAIRREKGLIVHRLIKINIEDGVRKYIARGDSNAYQDAPVGLDMIIGRIVGSEPTAENPVPADITINMKPKFILNRFRVIFILLRKKLKR
jgi:signal peptidase I